MAESATHVDMFHDIRKSAFTLAEVLVTLGIIGVVAAMTLPMLAKNYQFFIRQQQFKKAYAAVEIAVQKNQIDMGEGVRCFWLQNKTWEAGNWDDCDYFYDEFAKNLHVLKTCKGNALAEKCISQDMRGGEEVYSEVQGGDDKEAAKDYFNNSCEGYSSDFIYNKAVVYVLNSGFSIIRYKCMEQRHDDWTPDFLLDINGLQGPNKWGHDIFVFRLNKQNRSDSVFKVQASNKCHPLDVGGYYTTHFFEYLYGQNTNY